MNCEIVRNGFATECFRNVADEDYIAARTAYRMGLMNHFLWSSMQAVEKYLKAFLLINAVSSKGISHRLDLLYSLAVKVPQIGFVLPPDEVRLLQHLNKYGGARYLEQHIYTTGDELPLLDSLVWLTRRFCQPLNYQMQNNGKKLDMLALNLSMIHNSQFVKRPYKFLIIGGLLEDVLCKKPSDDRRRSLVWGNRHYGPGQPLGLRRVHCVNPPHIRHPEEKSCLEHLVHFPKQTASEIGSIIINGRRMMMGSFQLEQSRKLPKRMINERSDPQT